MQTPDLQTLTPEVGFHRCLVALADEIRQRGEDPVQVIKGWILPTASYEHASSTIYSWLSGRHYPESRKYARVPMLLLMRSLAEGYTSFVRPVLPGTLQIERRDGRANGDISDEIRELVEAAAMLSEAHRDGDTRFIDTAVDRILEAAANARAEGNALQGYPDLSGDGAQARVEVRR